MKNTPLANKLWLGVIASAAPLALHTSGAFQFHALNPLAYAGCATTQVRGYANWKPAGVAPNVQKGALVLVDQNSWGQPGVRRIALSATPAGDYTFIDNPGDNQITLGNGVTTQTVNLGSRTVDGAIAAGTTQIVNFDLLGVKVTLAGEQVEDAAGAYVDGELDGKTIIVAEGTGGTFRLGSDTLPADRMEYDIPDLSTASKTLDLSLLSIGAQDSARAAIGKIDQAIGRLTTVRGEVGAISNRLTHTLDFTANAIERVNASESTVRDTDYAWETSLLARNEILRQSTAAVFGMSQASPNMAMSLLQF